MIFSFAGYLLVFNKVFKLKASGHACGVIGPVLMMTYFKLYIPVAVCALFAIPVFIAGVHTKRHTMMQLLGGALFRL